MNLNWALQDNPDTSGGEAGHPGSHASCHSGIWILINFREESGIVSF